MSAPQIGFQSGGEAFIFRFGFTAICALEDEYDQPFLFVIGRHFPELVYGEVMDAEGLKNAKLGARQKDLRALLHAALVHHHPAITRERVAEIVDDLGVDQVAGLLLRAIRASQGGGTAAENPRNAPRRRRSWWPIFFRRGAR